MPGVVVAIHTAPVASAPVEERSAVLAVEGKGLEGDRNFREGAKPPRQVTLIEEEAIEALAQEHGMKLPPGGSRRNITTRGVRLNDLVGKRLRVGEAEILGLELCEPCRHLKQMTGMNVIPGLTHRAGLRAQILASGWIRVGDPVTEI